MKEAEVDAIHRAILGKLERAARKPSATATLWHRDLHISIRCQYGDEFADKSGQIAQVLRDVREPHPVEPLPATEWHDAVGGEWRNRAGSGMVPAKTETL